MTALVSSRAARTGRTLVWPLPHDPGYALVLADAQEASSSNGLRPTERAAIRIGLQDSRSLPWRLSTKWAAKIGAAVELLTGRRTPRELANGRLEKLRLAAVRIARSGAPREADALALARAESA